MSNSRNNGPGLYSLAWIAFFGFGLCSATGLVHTHCTKVEPSRLLIRSQNRQLLRLVNIGGVSIIQRNEIKLCSEMRVWSSTAQINIDMMTKSWCDIDQQVHSFLWGKGSHSKEPGRTFIVFIVGGSSQVQHPAESLTSSPIRTLIWSERLNDSHETSQKISDSSIHILRVELKIFLFPPTSPVGFGR